MLKNAVLQQKNERDQLLSRSYMPRDKLSGFEASLKSGLVKVITGPRSGLIQACYDATSPEAHSREVKALVEAGEELQCASLTVLTWDMESIETVKGAVIHFVPLWKWLLGETHS